MPYPSPNIATNKVDLKVNSIFKNVKTQVLPNNKDSKNLNLNDTYKNAQSELTTEVLAKLLGALINSVNSCLNSKREGRVTVVVAKARYHIATKNQAKQRVKHSARSHTSNAVRKVLLDSGSDGDLMFHEKGTPMHFPYLTRQVPNSWHTLNGSFLTKETRKVSLKFL